MMSAELNISAVHNYNCFLKRIYARETHALHIGKKVIRLHF